MDKLDTIFTLQSELADIIRDNETATPTTADICVALAHEVLELHDELGWKWWKRTDSKSKEERIADAKMELADIMHFMVQIAHNLGMTPADLFDAYRIKNMKNRQRQLDGY